MTRVLVCGGRDFNDADRVWSVLDYYHATNPFSVVIHGAARGADTLAAAWVQARGVHVLPFPADWENLETTPRLIKRGRDGYLYNARAGDIRNARMLREGKPDVVIAFPGGRGTANMIDQAERAGVPVLRVPRCP